MPELFVLLDGQVAGRVTFANNRLSFSYDDGWRRSPDVYPLSLSMPLIVRDHPHAAINAFIWNLLPDNDRTLDRWARQFQISAGNSFALIGAVGEDCAGAVQFVRPDRLDAMLSQRRAKIQWLDNGEIGDRLRSVLTDAASGRTAGENGQFSLAGAQPKTALLFDRGRWGVPSGRTPTTHILKPPAPDLPGHAENEHFCLNLARAVGLRAAKSTVRTFDGQLAIVVERYDRHRAGSGPGQLVRIHQEDMCQALAVLPSAKYQNEGGPSAAEIVRLVREVTPTPTAHDRDQLSRDVATFVDALIFNWIIGGTDAHAKNYSLLIGGEGTVRLAPLYDVASAYGQPDIRPQRMKLAMKVADYYLVERILPRHWERWAPTAGLMRGQVTQRIDAMIGKMPDALAAVAAAMRKDGLEHRVLDRLLDKLSARVERIAKM